MSIEQTEFVATERVVTLRWPEDICCSPTAWDEMESRFQKLRERLKKEAIAKEFFRQFTTPPTKHR